MADDETSSCIEYLIRQPIPNHILHSIILFLPLSSSPPPRLLKTILLRRLAGQLPSLPPQTLDTIERIEQIDRDHSLARSPSPAMRLAYAAVAVDLTARFLTEDGGELGDFFDAVNSVWNCRVGDLEISEARGLVSTRLREERRLMEEAVANRALRAMLMGRETEKEAREAVMAYLKEAAAELGPTSIEMAAASVAARGGGAGCKGMAVGGNDASLEDGCSMRGFNRLPELDSIQGEPIDKENHDMVEEPPLNTSTTALAPGVPTLGIKDDPNLERMDEHQNPINREHAPLVEKVAEVPDTRDIYGVGQNKDNHTVPQPSIIIHNPTQSEQGEENQTTLGGHAKVAFGDHGQIEVNTEGTSNLTRKSKYNDTVLQPSIIDQNQTELEHEEENHTTLDDGNAKASSVNKGKVAVNTEVTSNLSGKKRAIHDVHGPSIMDRNPTARTFMWHDDSVASSRENSPNPLEKFLVARSKRREIDVTNIPRKKEFIGRRTKKWWSADEEDTLRKAVDKFGAGHWSLIKSSYPDIFEDRTPGDLKDKWRNMTK